MFFIMDEHLTNVQYLRDAIMLIWTKKLHFGLYQLLGEIFLAGNAELC